MHFRDKRAQIVVITAGIVFVAAGIEAKTKSGTVKQPEKTYPAVMWREPADISSRDLFYGPGGKDHVPGGKFTFDKEDMEGSNPKFDVIDQDGVKWRVKLGQEARPETAASRLAWAIGYFANEDYFVPVLQVEKMPRLRRGRELVLAGGTMHDVRLKRHVKDEKKIGIWNWSKNPFTGTREWYGLRVLMAVLNNWDLKNDNNSVYLTHSDAPEERYAVSDLGASFGPTGIDWMIKGQPAAYYKSRFITNVSAGFVDFATPSGPALNYYINFPVLGRCMSQYWIGRHIPRADARWLGDLLGRLSGPQIRAAFRAAGYSSDEVEHLSQAVEQRIAALEKL